MRYDVKGERNKSWKMEGILSFLSCSAHAGDRIIPVCPILVPCTLALLGSLLVGRDIPATQCLLSKPAARIMPRQRPRGRLVAKTGAIRSPIQQVSLLNSASIYQFLSISLPGVQPMGSPSSPMGSPVGALRLSPTCVRSHRQMFSTQQKEGSRQGP